MIVIREYKSEDFEGLYLLLNDVYGSTIEQKILVEKYTKGNKSIIVAEDNDIGRIVGNAFIEKQIDYVRPDQILYVTYLAVEESYRGKNIGKRLMQYIEEYCRESGCSAVEFTSADYRTGAHAFYFAIGYKRKKTTHFIKQIN